MPDVGDEEQHGENEEDPDVPSEPPPPLSTAELLLQRQQKLAQKVRVSLDFSLDINLRWRIRQEKEKYFLSHFL